MKYYTKTQKDISKWLGMSLEHSYNLEKIYLTKITNNFECICKKKKQHFPNIYNFNDKNKSFLLRHCGYSIENISNNRKMFKNYKPINPREQIKCIIYNLKKSNIKHLDMNLSGRNLCLNKNGELSLIDFNTAVYKNLCFSKQMIKHLIKYGVGKNYYKKIKKLMLKILLINKIITK